MIDLDVVKRESMSSSRSIILQIVREQEPQHAVRIMSQLSEDNESYAKDSKDAWCRAMNSRRARRYRLASWVLMQLHPSIRQGVAHGVR